MIFTISIMADREASGLLMKVIRTLHETDTGQEREEQKKELERDFRYKKSIIIF